MTEAFDLSKLEPVAETVVLPSKGVFYKNDNKILFDNKGTVAIRPMTLREETLIRTPRIIKSGQFLNILLRECIKTPGVDVLKLLSTDRMFLFFYLRTISYGDDYSFAASCPHCEASNVYETKLSSLEIVYSKDTDVEPFELDVRGTKVLMRLSRGIDEDMNKPASNEQIVTNQEAPPENDEDKIVSTADTLVNLTLDIKGVPREYWRKFYDTMSPKDSAVINNKVEALQPGMKTSTTLRCLNPKCGKTFTDNVPITINFFRVSGK